MAKLNQAVIKKLSENIKSQFDKSRMTKNGKHVQYVREKIEELDNLIIKYKPSLPFVVETTKWVGLNLDEISKADLQRVLDNWDNLQLLRKALLS